MAVSVVAIPQPESRKCPFEHLRHYRQNVAQHFVDLGIGRKNVERLLQRLVGARKFCGPACCGEVALFENCYLSRALGKLREINGEAGLLGEGLRQFNFSRDAARDAL